jgi:hypothetical protein
MVPRMVRERSVLNGKNEKAKCMGLEIRCVLYPAHTIPSAKIDRWAKTWGSYHFEEDERV